MATIYVLVWALCVAEMFLCLLLIMPLPIALRRSLLNTLSSPSVRHQFRTTSLIVGVVLVAFFVVDVNESFRWLEKSRQTQQHSMPNPSHLQEYYQQLAQYFRSQRNYYLSGFSFFLLLVLNRFIHVLSESLKQHQDAETLRTQVGRDDERVRADQERIRKSENAVRDLETRLSQAASSESALKRQAENNNAQYMKVLADHDRLKTQLDRLQDQLTKKSTEAKKGD